MRDKKELIFNYEVIQRPDGSLYDTEDGTDPRTGKAEAATQPPRTSGLREALEHYAKAENWECMNCESPLMKQACWLEGHEYKFFGYGMQGYDVAREALAQTDNDGWTVIRDESDLPKKNGEYLWKRRGDDGHLVDKFSVVYANRDYWATRFIAWRPIPPYTPPSTGSGDAVEGSNA